MVDVANLNWDSSSDEDDGGPKMTARERERVKLQAAKQQAREEAKQGAQEEKKQREYVQGQAKAHAQSVVRFTTNPQMGKIWYNKPPNPQRVYEVYTQRFTRKFEKLPEAEKVPSDDEDEDSNTLAEAGESSRAPSRDGAARGGGGGMGEHADGDGDPHPDPLHDAALDAVALPPMPDLIAADGSADASPLDMLYTDEERELLGMLQVKNEDVRLKPMEHEEGWVFNEGQDDGRRWTQDPTWVVAFSEGASNRGVTADGALPNLPANMFDGNRVTQWTPNASLREGRHWVVLDFRTLKIVDGLRFLSNVSVKHTVRDFRVEWGPSQAGPWTTIDNYMYKHTDPENGSVETWLGWEATTRYIRFFVNTSVSAYAPAIQYMAFRFKEPRIEFSKAGLPINPQHAEMQGLRLVLRGEHFSQVVADNVVTLVPVEIKAADESHPHGVCQPRLQPDTFEGDKILMTPPTCEVTGASPSCLTVSVRNLQLMHVGALAAKVNVNGVESQSLVQVATLFEEVLDPFEFAKAAVHEHADKLFEAMVRHMKNAELQYCGLRNIIKMPTGLDEDGAPRDDVYTAIERIAAAMKEHPQVVKVQAWGCQALANIAEEHGNRVAIMGVEWLEQVQDAMLTLIQTKVMTMKHQDRKTMKMIEYEEIVVPEEALELAQYGCKLLCIMGYDEKNRDYVAGQGIPAVNHAMTTCEDDALVQAYGCEAIFNFIFRCENAWVQCRDINMLAVVEAAGELDKRDEFLQRRVHNALGALGPEGWLGRQLIRDLKLSEAREMVAKQHAKKKRAAARRNSHAQ